MLEQLLNHVSRHQLCKTTDKILLAVSGGVDSMVMLSLLHDAGFQITVAHCNFQLRGEESDGDENLVKETCTSKSIRFHVAKFDTLSYAESTGLSIQLAARNLRYEYFEKLRIEHRYDLIATAHHLNDSIETVLLNLTRGTGISGVGGIPVKKDFVIRPLLFATRDQILDYALLNNIRWREDKSNAEDEYQRNFIRHKVIPLLEEINPNFENRFSQSLERINGAIALLTTYLGEFSAKSITERDGQLWINRKDLASHQSPQTLLWELAKTYGFNFDQCGDAVAANVSGKYFLSGTHRMVIDREYIILAPIAAAEIPEVVIEEGQTNATNGKDVLTITYIDPYKENIEKRADVVQFDASRIKFPLCWRKWRAGDSFKPFGMNANKKISDFLIDLKVPITTKEMVTVLDSPDGIVWVVGLRAANDFKITKATTSAIAIRVSKTDG